VALLDRVQTRAKSLPSRVVIYAAEKMGKTSLACHAPKPIFLMSSGETGLLSLLDSGQVPETSYLPECRTFGELTRYIAALTEDAHDYKTAVHYHSGKALRITFTRLGENRLDRANLSTALKATEDAIAYMLGANDGDDRWQSTYEQEDSALIGVRVEIQIGE
jgi:hypothetical protein